MAKQNRIVCAANKFFFADGTSLIVTGARHWDMLMHAQVRALPEEKWNQKIKGEGGEIQGFVDKNGHFLTREEAWIVARDAEQILYLVGNQTSREGENKLNSENLY